MLLGGRLQGQLERRRGERNRSVIEICLPAIWFSFCVIKVGRNERYIFLLKSHYQYGLDKCSNDKGEIKLQQPVIDLITSPFSYSLDVLLRDNEAYSVGTVFDKPILDPKVSSRLQIPYGSSFLNQPG